MKALSVLLTLTIASVSFAGTGGYTTTNCSSDSGRTMVSTYIGDEEMSLTLVVDGKVSQYEIGKKGVAFFGNDETMIVKKNNSIQVALGGKGAKRQITIQAGADPRQGTDIDYVAKTDEVTIPVSCKSYTKEP